MILKTTLRAFGFLTSLIFLYLLLAILLTFIQRNSNYKQAKTGTEVFVSTNGVHTNIVLPHKNNQFDWNQYLKISNEYKYLAFGWGDREFYMNTPTWSDLKFTTAFKAAFLPTKTIMQVYGYQKAPKENENTVRLILNEEQFIKLSKYVLQSFQEDKKNQIIEIRPNKNYYFRVKFYPAKGTYSIFKTCNNWTNRGLKQAGIKNALWAPFDKSVMYHLTIVRHVDY